MQTLRFRNHGGPNWKDTFSPSSSAAYQTIVKRFFFKTLHRYRAVTHSSFKLYPSSIAISQRLGESNRTEQETAFRKKTRLDPLKESGHKKRIKQMKRFARMLFAGLAALVLAT